jgi:hypothetical protein
VFNVNNSDFLDCSEAQTGNLDSSRRWAVRAKRNNGLRFSPF